MSDRGAAEASIYLRVRDMLSRWLKRALDAVLSAWKSYRAPPDPYGIYSVAPEWVAMVDALIDEELEPLALGARVSTDSFVQAQIAQTRNLLVRVPDEVFHRIMAEISDATNAGEDTYETVQRIEGVLSMTGSQNWPNRAHVIAVTETTRALNSGALGSAFQAQSREGDQMFKRWLDSDDSRVRPEHRDADGQQVPIEQPFRVGESLLMFPGDPTGAPHDVINCRCSITIHGAGD